MLCASRALEPHAVARPRRSASWSCMGGRFPAGCPTGRGAHGGDRDRRRTRWGPRLIEAGEGLLAPCRWLRFAPETRGAHRLSGPSHNAPHRRLNPLPVHPSPTQIEPMATIACAYWADNPRRDGLLFVSGMLCNGAGARERRILQPSSGAWSRPVPEARLEAVRRSSR